MSTNPLNDISKVYLESVAESHVPGKPAEKLGAVTGISKADQMSAAERIKKKTAEKKAALEKKHGKKMDDHPEYPKKKYVDEKLDPVGQEDGDIDNDGDKDSSDKYLLKRRKAIGKAMKKRLKEERESLSEVIDDKAPKTVKEKKVNNKVIINPKLGEAVEEMGGTLIEHIEVDEMDFIVESVYDELIEEGYSEDDVESAIENAMEATVTFGHDTKAMKKDGSAVGSKRRFLKRKAKAFLGNMAAKAYNKGREAYKSKVEPKLQRAKTSAKRGIKKAAQKVVDKMSEEVVDEAVYGGEPAKKKDTRMVVTNADKKGNTPAYQKMKAGDKRYKAADHMNEVYKGKHGQSDKEYADSRSQGGKMISGDSKRSGAEYTHGRRVKAANPGMQPDVGGKTKPKSQGKMDKGTRADLEYRKANLRKEDAAMSPQELQLQKKKARIDRMIAMKRAQQLSKTKAGGDTPAKAMGEETEDSLRDKRMERGGVDGNTRYDKAPKFAPGPKKKSSGSDKAIDFVRREITAKYGKGALIDTKKKK